VSDEEIGSVGGPIGTIIGGIAGTIGGWWTRRAASEAANSYSIEDDNYYRDRYENSPRRLADRRFEEVRPAYLLGHLARINPEYRSREFDSIEPEIRVGWTDQISSRYGDWDQVREYTREAYTGDLAVTAREGALRNRERDDNFRGDRGDDGDAEARLELPVSRR
jgi:hypothetical protein